MNLNDIIANVNILTVAQWLGIKVEPNNKTCCIFHQEKTPSLQFYPETNSFFCFGCAKAGNIFDLVKKQRNCDFKEAVQYICSNAGITFSPHIKNEVAESSSISGLKLAYSIYADNTSHTKELLREWSANRYLAFEELQDWGALYIDGTELSCQQHLNISQWEGLHTAGMIYQKPLSDNEHQLYLNLGYIPQDFFFISGVLIPIRDTNGILQGFVCRKAESDSRALKYPKYKYNQYFKKSSSLLGADKVQKRINEFNAQNKKSETSVFDIFIVEGIIDAIRLSSMGLNALALMGTSLSMVSSPSEKDQNNQFKILKDFAEELSQSIVKFHIFLDNDAPGLQGAQKIAPKMLRLCNQCDNVLFDYIVVNPQSGKDPDDILKGKSKEDAISIIEKNTLSPADFLIAYGLVSFKKEAFDISKLKTLWKQTPYCNQHDILRRIRQLLSETPFYNYDLLKNGGVNTRVSEEYFTDAIQLLIEILRGKAITQKSATPFYENQTDIPWLDIIEKARVSYSDSDFPVDYASWGRMKQGEPVLRHFLTEQLQERAPIEPFVLSLVKRGEGEFPRILSLPCPEDLVIETAFLSELLNYGVCNPGVMPLVFDAGSGPVTYYKGTTLTKTVSFAYQFNCRAESVSGIYESQGLFKHFSECWNDYNQYLMNCANAYPFDNKELYCIRLDIHRYYDSISRANVKKLLDDIFSGDLLDEEKLSVLRNISGNNSEQRKTNIVQWICHRCYEYTYYSPDNGDSTPKKDNQLGIPQGPNLSAWLANILLFDLDRKIVEYCDKINSKYITDGIISSDQNVSWYARYVDDMVIVASTKQDAEGIRKIIEDHLLKLGLVLSDKIENDEIASVEAYRSMIKQNRGIISDPYGNVDEFIDTFNETAFSWAILSNYLDRKNLLTYIHSWDAIVTALKEPEKLKDNLINAVNATSEIRYRDYRKIVILVLHSIFKSEEKEPKDICDNIIKFFERINYKLDNSNDIDKTNFLQLNQVWPFFVICEAMQLLLISSYENKVLLSEDCKKKLVDNQKALARLILEKDLVQHLGQCFFSDDDQFYGLKHNFERWQIALQANATLRHPGKNDAFNCSSPLLYRFALSLGTTSNISIENAATYKSRAVVFQFHDLIHRLKKDMEVPLEKFEYLRDRIYFRVLCEDGTLELNIEVSTRSKIYFDAITVIARTVRPEKHFDVLKNRSYLLCNIIDDKETDIRLLPSPDMGAQKHIIAFAIQEKHNVKKVFVILPSFCESNDIVIYPNLAPKKLENETCCLDIYECELPNGNLQLPDIDEPASNLLSQLGELKNIFQALNAHHLDNAVLSASNILVDDAGKFYPIYWIDPKSFPNGLLKNGELRKFTEDVSVFYKKGCAALEFVGINVASRPKDVFTDAKEVIVDFTKLDWLDNFLVWYSRNLFSGVFLSYNAAQLDLRTQYFFDFIDKLNKQQLSNIDKIIQFFSFRLDYFLWGAEKQIEKEGMHADEKGSLLLGVEYITSKFFKVNPSFIQYLKGLFDPTDTYSSKALNISRKDVSAWYLIGELLEKIVNKQEGANLCVNVLPAAFKVKAAMSHLKSLCYDLKKVKPEVISKLITNTKISSIEILSQYGVEQLIWYKDESVKRNGVKEYSDVLSERIQALMREFERTDRNSQQIYPAGLFVIVFLVLTNTYTTNSQGQEIKFKFDADKFFQLLCFSLNDWKKSENTDNSMYSTLASYSDMLCDVLKDYETTIGIVSKLNKGFDPCNPRRNIFKSVYDSSIIYDSKDLLIASIGNGHYTESVDGEYFWSETWCGNIFLNISIITQPLADYINILPASVEICNTIETSLTPQEKPLTESTSGTVSPQTRTIEDNLEKNSSNEKCNLSKEDIKKYNDLLYKKQRELWFARRERNVRKTRVALCQFNVGHSSYYHLDERKEDELLIKPDYSILHENYEKEKAHIKEVLEKTIEICNDFSVDMLLLPEYSVSVEVLNWIINFLKETNSELKVWAGTSRNSGDLTEFEKEELDESIIREIMTPHTANLCIIDKSGVLYSRGKKYPAVALQEDFCPYDKPIEPLFKANKGPGKFVLELICSEIFMATSPANILALAASVKKLHNKYLPQRLSNAPTFKEDVIKDLIKFSEAVGFVADKKQQPDPHIKFDDKTRRTILFIPACTTRATDFHILGQGNVLAVGLCSVFCNAVSKKLHAAGQSCFIGFGSTVTKNDIMLDTPYSGFMPGVLYPPYGKPLDKNEESLVIADIDPYYMNEGKPRQQHLPPPIELVAHIPFLQVKEESSLQEKNSSIMRKILEVTENSPSSDTSEEYKSTRVDKTKEILNEIIDLYNVQKGESLELRRRYLINEKYHTTAALLPAAVYDLCFIKAFNSK